MEKNQYIIRKLRQIYYLSEKKLVQKIADNVYLKVKDFETIQNCKKPWLIWMGNDSKFETIKIDLPKLDRKRSPSNRLAEVF